MTNQPIEEKRNWQEEFDKKFDGLWLFLATEYKSFDAGKAPKESIVSFIENLLEQEKRRMGEVERVLERHTSWKPTEGHSSEEELGFQKGLMAEAKLIKKEILSFLGNDHKCGGELCIVCGYREKLNKAK